MRMIFVIIIIFLALILGTLEVYRWYRKGYEEGFDDSYNDAVHEMMEKVK